MSDPGRVIFAAGYILVGFAFVSVARRLFDWQWRHRDVFGHEFFDIYRLDRKETYVRGMRGFGLCPAILGLVLLLGEVFP